MLSEEEFKRYNRQIIIPELGLEGQEKLKKSKVLVIGCGGLGSPILLYLTAAGIGTLGIVENDLVDISNLQRQILYKTSGVGEQKVLETEKLLKQINPHVNIIKYSVQLSTQNALEILKDFDIIVDSSDNFPTRYLVNDACVMLNKPFVYGAIHRFEGQVAIFNYQGSGTYRDLFSSPPPPEQAPNCSEAGILGMVAGIIGSMQALETVKIIAGIGTALVDKLLILDSLSMQSRIIKLMKPVIPQKITNLIDYDAFCGLKSDREITFQDLKQFSNYQLIDVREENEYLSNNIGGEPMPLSKIENFIASVSQDKPVIIHCQSGVRSLKAIDLLEKKYGFTNLYNLKGGINSIG